MRTSLYFRLDTELYKAYVGRWGVYARYYGSNESEKKMLARGYVLEHLTAVEAAEYNRLNEEKRKRAAEEYRAEELKKRFKQVEICLKSDPLPIVPNSFPNPFVPYLAKISDGMLEAYHGCGKGTAYIRDNKVIAYHYGYEYPNNIPSSTYAVKVELSCTEICFPPDFG